VVIEALSYSGQARGRGKLRSKGCGGVGISVEWKMSGHSAVIGESNVDHMPLHMRLKATLMQGRTPSKLTRDM
jgi:hypothetical protein